MANDFIVYAMKYMYYSKPMPVSLNGVCAVHNNRSVSWINIWICILIYGMRNVATSPNMRVDIQTSKSQTSYSFAYFILP